MRYVRDGGVPTVFLAGVLAAAMLPVLPAAADGQAAPGAGWLTFVDPDRLDPDVPRPETVIGHAVGADAVRYEALVRYLRALDEASDLVTLTRYGVTHEGRPLFYLTITSPRNHARLDAIRAGNAKLADPRRLGSDEEAERLVAEQPGIAWLAYSIHGDEVSPCDSAMIVAYLLAAGRDEVTRKLRDELVILIDPLQNPDGRERYLAQIQTLRGKVPNPDVEAMHHAGLWSAGRGNHYLFDLNRDWLMQAHPETRGRAAAILEWNPHLVVDAHEMGALDTYLFDPPREPLNPNISPTALAWRRTMSADQARAFDAHGWSYYTQEWYEEWYPGYTNGWATLVGAIGLLYEQAGVNGASVKQAAGNVLRYDEAVLHNVVSSFANLQTLQGNREAILADYLAERRTALSGEAPFHEIYLFPPDRDRSRRARFVRLLERQGIETITALAPLRAELARDLWGVTHETVDLTEGTLAVPAAQPRGALVRAILDLDPHLTDAFLLEERRELERGRGSRLYDVTAWNLPMAFGLETYVADRVSGLRAAAPAAEPEAAPAPPDAAGFGYLIPWDDADVYRVLARLLAGDARVRIARKPFTLAGRVYGRGTLLLRNNENGGDPARVVADAAGDIDVEVVAADTALSDDGPDLGGREFVLLHEPRVAIASQWPTSTTSFGAVWFLLDERVGLRASPVNVQNLGRMDLRKYNVLILPSSRGLDRVLGAAVAKRLRTWVESGGTLIAIGGAADTLASKDVGLCSTRRRRDVLDELEVYDEHVERELAARTVQVSPDAVWHAVEPEEGAGDDAAEASERDSTDAKTLERADAWARRFSPQGAILLGRTDPEHWLCFGLGDRVPVLVGGRTAYLARPPAVVPVRLGSAASLRLGGLLWPEARTRLEHSAYATVERVGNGQVVLFAFDPFYRGYWESTGRMLLNATIVGPGMGTSQPLPW